MGTQKEKHIAALDSWHKKKPTENISCPVCGQAIRDDDRELFYEKAMCSACNEALDTHA